MTGNSATQRWVSLPLYRPYLLKRTTGLQLGKGHRALPALHPSFRRRRSLLSSFREKFAAPGIDLPPPEWIWRASPRFGAPASDLARLLRIWRACLRFGAPRAGTARPPRIWRPRDRFGAPGIDLPPPKQIWRARSGRDVLWRVISEFVFERSCCAEVGLASRRLSWRGSWL